MRRLRSCSAALLALLTALALACERPEPTTAAVVPREPSVEGGATGAADTDGGAEASGSVVAGGRTLFVDGLVDCEGEGPMKCLHVRDAPDAEWRLLYGDIEGFSYEPGYTYELKVEVRSRPNPTADLSSRRLHLVEIVSKRRAE